MPIAKDPHERRCFTAVVPHISGTLMYSFSESVRMEPNGPYPFVRVHLVLQYYLAAWGPPGPPQGLLGVPKPRPQTYLQPSYYVGLPITIG